MTVVEYRRYERSFLEGVIALCLAEGWPSFSADPERADRVLRAPGVTSVVAVAGDGVVGFCYVQSDGEIQAHLSNLVVDRSRRGAGIGRALVAQALEWAGGVRIDLITDTADEFYRALGGRAMSGFRLWPGLNRE